MSKLNSPWGRFFGELIVPVLLLSYASHYYVSVRQLPRPETNLLLIGPVYWVLVICSLIFVGGRLRTALRDTVAPEADISTSLPKLDLWKSTAFIVLTGFCIWAIPVLGFVIATLTYTFLLLLALGVRSRPILVLVPVVQVGLLWVGMEYYLNLRLPSGLFF
ncbi:tripartite tricarboxylate transporter TctB family protein [Roseovarius pelagicus]|uniref:Tripartite tricarboxylate transporter TctB family protein n=1 Tax=Roseovarius pelagicus TaxID=2980108 RepID=A0ABY6DAJ6_9RHOB|nr:tripartite tricarboxylate transporter TctB family protein [Roseovarius pelagicus]UXX83161.1 tripartite tricarboxylate transporter TctB family protein [Roseovarius pelagicus]